MRQTNYTYGQLCRVIRSFGFRQRIHKKEPPQRVFNHASGARIMLPRFPLEEQVWEHHLAVTRFTLDQWGIADPTEFEAEMRMSE